jgi:hypothetical protein
MISTRDLSALPSIYPLKKLTQSLAMLDAVIQRRPEGRYYSFDAHWSIDEQMASMHNGEGDDWFCVFSKHGAFLKGLDHESKMARGWPGVLESVPEVFRVALTEPAFSIQYTSFCIWRTLEDNHWHAGKISYPPGADPDGSAWMLAILDGDPVSYQRWAEEYYKRPANLAAVEHIYSHKPLTDEIVRSLNTETSLLDCVMTLPRLTIPLVGLLSENACFGAGYRLNRGHSSISSQGDTVAHPISRFFFLLRDKGKSETGTCKKIAQTTVL